jgi:histidyl-tRNA synthetase
VRGLDYYTGVVFEAASGGLGAQDALAGGGRYDKLYGELGGGSVPCTGWSIGFERLLMALDSAEAKFSDKTSSKTFGFICLSQQDAAIDYFKAQVRCVAWAGVSVAVEPLFLKKDVKSGLRYVVLFGDDEFQKKVWMVKDLQEKTQIEVSSENLEATLRGLLAKGRAV